MGVAMWQNKRRGLAVPRADGAENIGRGCALIVGCRRPRAAFGPASRDLVLLADPGLVPKPDLYIVRVDTFGARDLTQDGREFFLKSSIAPSACA